MAKSTFLHNHPDFVDLLRIVADEKGIDPSLVEKDYWIMHCLYGLQQTGLTFKLKGGTSLSKAYGIIHRFSEDIDLQIDPPADMDVMTGRNQKKPAHRTSRVEFYDWLAGHISIDGITEVVRDRAFDDVPEYRSAGIRLSYETHTSRLEGVKDGILLETGFDDISPNQPVTISSWAYDHAEGKVDVIDNRAIDVDCYNAGYTFVEKLQAISTKYRKRQTGDNLPANFMRHYYDIYCLLANDDVQAFIGTSEYKAHKKRRFPNADNQMIAANDAFLLNDTTTRTIFEKAYIQSASLYYQGQPSFGDILARVFDNIGRL